MFFVRNDPRTFFWVTLGRVKTKTIIAVRTFWKSGNLGLNRRVAIELC